MQWQPSLILPDLSEGATLAFLSERPSRGDIYDINGVQLASLGQMVTIGVVPQSINNQPATIDTLAQVTGVPPENIMEKNDPLGNLLSVSGTGSLV